jgi:O-antigen/teichoic acid export membrane protein
MADSSGTGTYLASLKQFLRDALSLRSLRDFFGRDRASLRARILSAGAWILGGHGAEMAIRFASSLIVTRILFPEAFGLMAFVGAILLGLTLVSDLGIHVIIIRDEGGEDEGLLRSAWTVQFVRGIALWLVFIAIALAILVADKEGLLPSQSTLADPMLPAILPVVGLNAVLMGFESVNTHLLVRRLTFKPLVVLDTCSRFMSLPVILAWASFDRSVWALVAGQLATGISRTLASHIFLPGPRMAPRWDQDHVRKLFHSGKWVAISSTATFFSTQGDRLILGAFLSSSTLGIYSVAWFLKDAFESVLQRYHGSMTLPMLGETLRERPRALRERFYRFRAPFEAAAFFVGGALIVSGGKIVELLYDQRYLDAGWMLQILALALITYPMQMIGTGLLAAGEMSKFALISIINAVSLVILISIGYWIGGLPGAIFGVALYRLPANMVVMTFAHNRDWINLSAELRYAPLVGVGMITGLAGIWLMRGLGLIS